MSTTFFHQGSVKLSRSLMQDFNLIFGESWFHPDVHTRTDVFAFAFRKKKVTLWVIDSSTDELSAFFVVRVPKSPYRYLNELKVPVKSGSLKIRAELMRLKSLAGFSAKILKSLGYEVAKLTVSWPPFTTGLCIEVSFTADDRSDRWYHKNLYQQIADLLRSNMSEKDAEMASINFTFEVNQTSARKNTKRPNRLHIMVGFTANDPSDRWYHKNLYQQMSALLRSKMSQEDAKTADIQFSLEEDKDFLVYK